MKYIKLFENFDSEDMLEEAKYILISHLGEVKEIDLNPDVIDHMPSMLKNNVRFYKLLDSPNVKDLKSCEDHLKAETEGLFWHMNIGWNRDAGKVCVIGVGESIEDFCMTWLKERFDGGELYRKEDSDRVIYLDNKNGIENRYGGVSIFYYYEKDGQDRYCYINPEKIWKFFDEVLGLDYSEITKIIKKWLLESLNLNLDVKKW
jgi:hypothetical protein